MLLPNLSSDLLEKMITHVKMLKNKYSVIEDLKRYGADKDVDEIKRKLKSKFVTGQSSDRIVKNLLNMSDSEGEEDAEKRKLDKE